MAPREVGIAIFAGIIVIIIIAVTILYGLQVPFPAAEFGQIASASLGALIVLATRHNGNGNGKGKGNG